MSERSGQIVGSLVFVAAGVVFGGVAILVGNAVGWDLSVVFGGRTMGRSSVGPVPASVVLPLLVTLGVAGLTVGGLSLRAALRMPREP